MTPLVLMLLPGCVIVCDDCVDPPIECVDAAMRDANGDPDGCDLSACVSCIDECGADCRVLESYPPQYACDDVSFDVYDFCPTWEPPTGTPRAASVQDLGCGAGEGEALLAEAPIAGHIDVTHYDFADGCCPDAIDVDVTVTDSTLAVTYTPTGDDCDCVCGLDVSYALVDVPAGTWTLQAGLSAITATVTVP